MSSTDTSKHPDTQHAASGEQAAAGSHHGEGGEQASSRATLSAAAASFRPGGSGSSGGGGGGALPTSSRSAAASGAAVGSGTGQSRPGRGGSGCGRGGRGRGGLSREFQSQGGGKAGSGGPRAGRGGGRGGSAGGRQHEDPVSSGAGGARRATEAGAGSGRQQQQQPHEGVMGSSPGRRGFLSANHLLGFQSRRESEGRGGGRGSSGGRGAGRGGGGRAPPRRPPPKPQPYDRNKFLQANFRFLVSDAVDVRRFQADPDLMLEWEDVVQVEMLSAQPVRCPITLDEKPFCPQITPCGHVFSFPAIVGHLVNHGGPELRKSAPCPLCYTQIAARELRLVQVHHVSAPGVGQPATFQLLRRPRDSIIPELVGAQASPRGPGHPQHAAVAAAGAQAAGSPGKGKLRTAVGEASSTASDDAQKHAWAGQAAAGRSSGGSSAGTLQGAAGTAGASGSSSAGRVACDPFCKFTLVGEATPLFVGEAQRLAQHAAQVTAEGGLEAAYEAPNIYSAIDALAARARAAAERRQRLLLEAADPMAQDALLSPEEAGAQAAAAVKGATTAALSAAAVQREQAAAAAAREQAFPSLSAAAAPTHMRQRQPQAAFAASHGSAGGTAPAAAAVAAAGLEVAFSDEAGPAAAQEAGHAPEPAGPRRQPATAAVPISGPASLAGGGASGPGADLSTSVKSAGGGMLGSSPADAGPAGQGGGDYFFYQAADGQWFFLCTLNLRMLLAHYGSYSAFPPTITAKVLELEDVTQDDASRRRMRVLAHLPLTATFKLCEADLSGLLSAEALAPFAEELAQREKKRAQRAKQEARRLKQERAAAAAAAAAAAKAVLSPSELRAMPLPSASLLPPGMNREAVEGAAAAAAGSEEERGPSDDLPPTPPQPGISFAAIARDGFAATGPSLSSQAASAAAASGTSPGGPPAAAPAGARGAWGAPQPAQGAPAASAWGPAAAGSGLDVAAAQQQLGGLQVSSSGKGSKGKKLLLFGGLQRKY